MAITYNAGTNIITVTGYTEAVPCTFLNIYNADVAGGWGKVTQQCTNQFCFGAYVHIGDGSTSTWFADTKKNVFWDEIGGNWAKYIEVKSNAHFRLGTLVNDSKKTTRDGCSISHASTSYPKRLINAVADNADIQIYSTYLANYGSFRGMGVDGEFASSPSLKIYNSHLNTIALNAMNLNLYNVTITGNISINDSYGIPRCTGTCDTLVMLDLERAIHVSYGANYTLKNIVVRAYGELHMSSFSGTLNIINGNLDEWKFNWSGSGGGKCYEQYEYDSHVKKADKTNFASRPVTIWQRAGNNSFVDGDKVYTGNTDASGNIPTQILTWGYYDRAHNNSLQQYYHKILIEGDSDHLDYETEFDPDYKRTEDITMVDVSDIVDGITDIKGTGFVKDTDSMVDTAGNVWDEILTGATHNIATSAGRRVREIGAYAIHSGTAQGGNSHSITLAATAAADDGIYNRNLIVLVDNTGTGQTRTIVDYNATTKVVVVDRDWRVPPDATTAYQITPDDTPLTVDHGAVQAGTARTITIREYASGIDDTYLCNIITIIAGTGRGQARLIGGYNGTTKVATICGDDWVTTPDTSSIYVMMPYGASCTACISTAVLRDLLKAAGVLL